MAEVLVEFEDPVLSSEHAYVARVCGRMLDDGRWEGWLEFTPGAGGAVVRTARETVQPDYHDLRYWATGLTATYLEGALQRALHPLEVRTSSTPEPRPAYAAPAPAVVERPPAAAPVAEQAVLDPFAVYAQGEERLAGQLAALDETHLRAVIREHRLVDEAAVDLAVMSRTGLAELILGVVRRRMK